MATRESILENTSALFMSRGCKSLTMDDIASQNGISKRTLYEQFKDKSTLLEACIIYMDDIMTKNIAEHQKLSKNILELILRIYDFQTDAIMDMHDNFFSEVNKYFPDVYQRTISKIRERSFENTEKMLILGQIEGVFIKDISNPKNTAIVINEMIRTVLSSEIVTKFKYSKTEILKNIMLVYLRGLSTEIGRKTIDEYFMYLNNK